MFKGLNPGIGAIAFLLAAHSVKADAISQPLPFYTAATTPIDIDGIADGTTLGQIQGGGLTVSFSSPVVKLSVPGTWATWNSPAATETATPSVLYSNGASDVIMTLISAKPVYVFGFEAQPDLSEIEPMTATFFNGAGSFSIPLNVNGEAGALLFALSSDTPISSVDLSNASGDDFAIANVRFDSTPLTVPTPEPSMAPVLALLIAVLGFAGIRSRSRVNAK